MTRAIDRDDLTLDLFNSIPQPAPATPGSMDFRPQLSHLVSKMLAAAYAADETYDRYYIAAICSRLCGKEVSKLMLDGYTAESRETFNLPLYLVPALETACKSTLLTEWLAEVRGGRLLLGPAAIDAEIGRLESTRYEAAETLKQLRLLRRKVR